MARIFQETRSDKKRLFRSLLRKGHEKSSDRSDIWNNVHLKSIITIGRGGKGHGMTQGIHSWNRKGRW